MSEWKSGNSRRNPNELPFGATTALIGAGALVLFGLTRRSKLGTAVAAAGGALAYTAWKNMPEQKQHARAVFQLNASASDAYDLWRDFAGLPRFMAHLKQVNVLDDKRSEWTVIAPGGSEVSWTAEITQEEPGRRIGWRSLPGSAVETAGHVEFRPHPQGRGSFVEAHVVYTVPAGPLTTALATLLGKNPQFVVREDVRRFKALLETGEVPTTLGQSHGPRGMHGRAEQFLFRETSNRIEPQARKPQSDHNNQQSTPTEFAQSA